MVMNFIVNNIEFFIFALILTIFLYIKRKNLVVQGPFPVLYMMLYRTRLGLDRMNSWSKKHPKVFLYLSYFSIFIAIFGTILTFIFMIWQLNYIVVHEFQTGGGFVLPLKTDSGLDGAVPIFFVPFWYWLIALFILAIVHEFAHGVIAERFNVKIKSSGFAFGAIFLPILPAAFVEPDEKSLAKKKWWQQVAVFGAGSTSNFIFGFLFLLMWIFIAAPIVDNTMEVGSINFTNVINQSDLYQYNFSSGSILAVDGIYDKRLIVEKITNLSVNQTINLSIQTNQSINNYTITTYQNPQFENKGMIGISGLEIKLTNKEGLGYLGDSPLYFERLLFWIWFLNIGIGIMNLLPIWITDGGQILRTMLLKFVKSKNLALRIYTFISFASLALIIFTIKPDLLLSILNLF